MACHREYTTAQGERVQKEAAWNAMKSGSLEAAQVSSQGQDLAKLSDSLNQARQRFALVKSTYGSTHPEYRKAASELAEVERQFESTRSNIAERIAVEYREALNREQMLQKAVAETKAEWDGLNSRSFEYQQLKREAEADKTLYDELHPEDPGGGHQCRLSKQQHSDRRFGKARNSAGLSQFNDCNLFARVSLFNHPGDRRCAITRHVRYDTP